MSDPGRFREEVAWLPAVIGRSMQRGMLFMLFVTLFNLLVLWLFNDPLLAL